MKKEDFEYLKQFEDRFLTATKSNYARSIQSKDVEKIRAIYSDINGQPYRMNSNCSACVLKLLQKVSPYYFEFKNDRRTNEEIIGESAGTQKSEKRESGKADQIEGNSSSDRYGTEEEGDPETVGKRKRSKGNRRVS